MEQSGKTTQPTEGAVHRHSKVITGYRTLDGQLHWRYKTKNLPPDEDETIEVRFFMLIKHTPAPQKGDTVRKLLKQMENTEVPWLVPGRTAWAFDLDRMKQTFPDLQELGWCRGKIFLEPGFEVKREIVDISQERYYETSVVFYIHPRASGMTPYAVRVEIQQSLLKFQADHPDPRRVAFIMMRFGKTSAHDKIVQGIRDALAPHGIEALRADDKEYHPILMPNIFTYLHGCGFGIAVFERIEQEEFNPNVALEVGYIMALGKEVCLLKDRTLRALQTDLGGHIFRIFDPQDPITTIPPELTKWATDKGII
jgi:hypothetical protein